MPKEFAKSFYWSPEWIRCRKAFIKHRVLIDGGLCQECGEHPGDIVHHRTHITPDNINNPEVTLDWKNLEYVCINCHNDIHGRTQASKGMVKYNFAPDGNVIVLPTPNSPP